MWAPRDFSYRKFERKIDQEGGASAVKASFELVSRSVLAPPVFRRLFKQGDLRSVSRQELLEWASVVAHLDGADTVSTPFAANINQGYVFPTTGLVLTNAGNPVDESVGPADDDKNGVIKSLVRHGFVDGVDVARNVVTGNTDALEERARTLDTICPLSYRYINYYHWTIETLPRIRYARAYEEQTNDEVTYIVWSDAPAYVDETLELLGVPERKIERATSTVYRGSNVIVPSFPEQTTADYRWIRETVLENADPDTDSIDIGSNVYISRSNAIERQIVNEQEVVDALSRYGFEPYVLENQSVAQNVQLFHEADAVVGAHGAGLTDLIYCDDATVFELFGSKVKDPYERLADTVGVDYQPIQCQPDSTDIVVDIGHLERTLENVLET